MPLGLSYFNIFKTTESDLEVHTAAFSQKSFGMRISPDGFHTKQILSPTETARKITQSYHKDALSPIKTVVIDAGHGGHDPGTSGKYSKEKNIALQIALKLSQFIKQEHSGVRVILTRDKDVFIPLHERAKIANDAKADLFISIHCNAIKGSTATAGTETYVLGNHRMEENLQTAMRENSSILFEQDYEQIYNFNPNSPEGYIIMSMYQDIYQDQSIRFAQKVEDQMSKVGSQKSRGVKQAGFIVLKATAMPSVLVETGFLTNRTDENYLRSAVGQNQIAQKIAKAYTDYSNEISYLTRGDDKFESIPNKAPTDWKVSSSASPDLKPKGPIDQSAKSKKTIEEFNAKRNNKSNQYNYSSEKLTAKSAYAPIEIKIQLAASKKRLDISQEPWTSVNGQIEVIQEAGFYKYLLGNFKTTGEAERNRLNYHKLGFSGAFTVYYKDGKRISQAEARSQLQ
jgi:N-acetylmuramoyl-L-alanine amidase